jgi:lysine--tRNA ligase
MEYGMPPQSGFGMGLERILAILTEQENLRDVVMFPLMKARNQDVNSEDEEK